MPITTQIEAASALTVGQATRLISLLKSSERYQRFPFVFSDLDARVLARVSRLAAITNATNASPIVITATAHGFVANDRISVSGVEGNDAANASWLAANVTDDTLELKGSVGSGAYTIGGLLIDYVSKLLAAITDALDLLEDDTVAFKGGSDGIDYSTERDREKLCQEALDGLYTASEQEAGFTTNASSYVRNVAVW